MSAHEPLEIIGLKFSSFSCVHVISLYKAPHPPPILVSYKETPPPPSDCFDQFDQSDRPLQFL